MTGPASVSRVGLPVPFDKMTAGEQLSELFYRSAVEVTKPAYLAINRAFPVEDRRDVPKTEYRFQEAHRQAKQHLNFYKRAVKDFVETFVIAKRHPKPYDAAGDNPTSQLRTLFQTQLEMLRRRLSDYAPLMMPPEDIPSFLEVLEDRFVGELKTLLAAIAYYEADPRQKDYMSG